MTGPVWTTSLRKQNANGTLVLTVPKFLAVEIDHLAGREFVCDLTEDGILFRLVPDRAGSMPEWAEK